MHRIFYEVNCDREKLIKSLEGNKVMTWGPLEDLAVKSSVESEEYKYLID